MADIFQKVGLGGGSMLNKGEKHYRLAEKGERKLTNMEVSGRVFEILDAVRSKGPCTASDVGEKINWPPYKVQSMLDQMKREEYVMEC